MTNLEAAAGLRPSSQVNGASLNRGEVPTAPAALGGVADANASSLPNAAELPNGAMTESGGVEPLAPLWHTMEPSEVMAQLGVGESGLSEEEAAARLVKYGRNVLTEPYKPSFLRKLWSQINNILIYILIVAAIIAALLQEWPDVVLVGHGSGGLGFDCFWDVVSVFMK